MASRSGSIMPLRSAPGRPARRGRWLSRAPAAHPQTTGSGALENIDSKNTGRVAPAAHPQTTGSGALENIDSKNTGRVAPAAHPQTTGSGALENIDSKNTGRVAR